jgi:hypothetical protein
MSENSKTQEFLKKLAPCVECGDLDACVEEVARDVVRGELMKLSSAKGS